MTLDSFNTTVKWLLIVIAIACISIVSICIYKHFNPKLPVFNPTSLQDSISVKEQQMGHIIDSLISRNNHMIGSADSLGALIVTQEIELNGRKILTEDLSDQYKSYRAKYDTINALHKCDTLAEEITKQDLALMEYEDSNGKLYDSLQSTTGNTSLVLAKKDYLYSVLRSSFDSLSQQYQVQGLNLQKADKPKRWGIGLQTGITYWSGIRVYAGAGISYNFLRF